MDVERRPGKRSRKGVSYWKRNRLWLLQLRKTAHGEKWWCLICNSCSRNKLLKRWINWPDDQSGVRDWQWVWWVERRMAWRRQEDQLARHTGLSPDHGSSGMPLQENGHYLLGNSESLRIMSREGHNEINFSGRCIWQCCARSKYWLIIRKKSLLGIISVEQWLNDILCSFLLMVTEIWSWWLLTKKAWNEGCHARPNSDSGCLSNLHVSEAKAFLRYFRDPQVHSSNPFI